MLQKMARVVKEKAAQDFGRIVKGTEKTRQKLGVLEELFTYWNLEDADDELEELEDALIVRRSSLWFLIFRVQCTLSSSHVDIIMRADG